MYLFQSYPAPESNVLTCPVTCFDGKEDTPHDLEGNSQKSDKSMFVGPPVAHLVKALARYKMLVYLNAPQQPLLLMRQTSPGWACTPRVQ